MKNRVRGEPQLSLLFVCHVLATEKLLYTEVCQAYHYSVVLTIVVPVFRLGHTTTYPQSQLTCKARSSFENYENFIAPHNSVLEDAAMTSKRKVALIYSDRYRDRKYTRSRCILIGYQHYSA